MLPSLEGVYLSHVVDMSHAKDEEGEKPAPLVVLDEVAMNVLQFIHLYK
jgi:hypothetical protein